MSEKLRVYRMLRMAQGESGITCEVKDEETKKKYKVSGNALVSECEAKKLIVRDMDKIWWQLRKHFSEYPGAYLPVTAVERTEDGWKVKPVGWKSENNPGNSNYWYMTNEEIRTYLEDGNLYVFDNLKLSVDHKVIQGKPQPGVSMRTTGEARLTRWGKISRNIVSTRLLYDNLLYKPKPEMLYRDTPKAFGLEIDKFLDNVLAYADDYYGSRYLGLQKYLGEDAKVHEGPVLVCVGFEDSFIETASYLLMEYTGNSIIFTGTGPTGRGFKQEIEMDNLRKYVDELSRRYIDYRSGAGTNFVARAMYTGANDDEREYITLASDEQSLRDDYNNGNSEESEKAYYALERLSALRARYGSSKIEAANAYKREARERIISAEAKEEKLIVKQFRPNLGQMKKMEKLKAAGSDTYGLEEIADMFEEVTKYNFKQPNRLTELFGKSDLSAK